MATNSRARLNEHSEKLERRLPHFGARAFRWLRTSSRWVRIPLAVLLIVGGVFGFLPILGFWMIPPGVILIAQDLPFLHDPLANLLERVEKRWSR